VLHKKKTKKYVLTKEILDNIGVQWAWSPKKLQQKLLKLQPYRTTVVHNFLPPDCEARIDIAGCFRNLC
jgi:hypothetical protein